MCSGIAKYRDKTGHILVVLGCVIKMIGVILNIHTANMEINNTPLAQYFIKCTRHQKTHEQVYKYIVSYLYVCCLSEIKVI